MCDDTDNPFLTVQETADLLRVKRRTLDNLRWKNEGPPWRRHGGRIVYHRDEVLAWSEQRRARSGAADENTSRRPARHARPAPQRQNTAPVSNGHNWPSSGAAYRSRATPPRAPVEHKP